MVPQLPWQLDFLCNRLAILAHVDEPEPLSTHPGRWVAPSQSEQPTTFSPVDADNENSIVPLLEPRERPEDVMTLQQVGETNREADLIPPS